MHQRNIHFKWNSHHENVYATLEDEICNDINFADVTLVSDDLQFLKAHKYVLSSCSTVFKEILIKNPHEHPIVYLAGVKQQELQYLLQLMYFGEAKIQHEHLQRLVTILIEYNMRGFEIPEMLGKTLPMDFVKSRGESHFTSDDNKSTQQISNETKPNMFERKGYFMCRDCEAKFKGPDGLKRHIDSIHNGVRYGCEKCGNQYSQMSSLSAHQRRAHEGLRFACDRCDSTYSGKGALRQHQQSKHEGVRFECDQCDYKAMYKHDLKFHKKNMHDAENM